ncbi:MAG TPA: LLM class flavin-dependent oxidoreductase, partial [Deltaproteobacteria bacterium]|nr:LLM class flavin-dependent oxidoreductase [Deltaproteobacteria bacterium]
SAGGLYREAIEMAAWADRRRIGLVGFSEHHVTPEGFLPAPFPMAAAVAARTRRVRISIAALLVNLYDPIHLAEEIAVLDLLSQGRFSVTLGLGYREIEYRAFGIDWADRGRRLDGNLEILLAALRGESFVRHGVEMALAPLPASPIPGLVTMGGNSVAAARRAGRSGLVFCPALDDPELVAAYHEASRSAGNGEGVLVSPNSPATTLIDEDPDRAWAEVGAFLVHHAETYGAWAHPDRRAYAEAKGRSIETLRDEGKYRILTPEEAARALRETGSLHLAPLTSGIDPRFGWKTLELFESRVEPLLA